MKTLSVSACAAAFALVVGASSPGVAAPRVAPVTAIASQNFFQVQGWGDRGRWTRGGPRFGGRSFGRPHFGNRQGAFFYNGHRGFRDRRAGYRFYNGWWFPPAAFAMTILPGPVASDGADAHVQWCYDRWRSYRAWDNSYQPNNGPRRRCVSPYGG